MRTTTKIFVLTLFLLLISNFAFSQGIYKTHQDYLNKKLTYYGSYSGFNSGTVVFEDSLGNKTEIKAKDGAIWGYQNNEDGDYRVNKKGYGHKILMVGKIMLYGDNSESGSTTYTSYTSNQTRSSVEYFSFGLNGEMKQTNKIAMRKVLEKRKDKEGLKMFKKVSAFNGYWVRDFIRDYNKKFN